MHSDVDFAKGSFPEHPSDFVEVSCGLWRLSVLSKRLLHDPDGRVDFLRPRRQSVESSLRNRAEEFRLDVGKQVRMEDFFSLLVHAAFFESLEVVLVLGLDLSAEVFGDVRHFELQKVAGLLALDVAEVVVVVQLRVDFLVS